ncbi:MAG: hypothetical protein E6J90_38030 [Deltaproteobacteria bacterium]|nr:MAG: hypothetical protein E6J90_38030 [Deltaproteobacteria bacterium]TMQ16629.1 MAG: hypothetical protein E6J91_11350 [Deltaproteobacteria bacterium]
MRVLVQHPRSAAALIGIALAAVEHPAAAQQTDVEANATANLGYNQQTQSVFVPDPNGQPQDMPSSTSNRLFLEIRPGISLQSGSPRLAWSAGYIFSGTLAVVGDQSASYSNAANASLAAQATKFTTVTIAANAAQGGTSFQLTARPADAGQPELRAPGSPDQVSATLAETLSNELAKHLTLQQALVGAISAPQDAIGQRNSAVSGSLALDQLFETDTIGAEVHGSVSWLRPLRLVQNPYKSYTSSIQAHWNHDFTAGWNAMVSAGIEQVFTDTGSRPLAFLPAGALSVRYALGESIGGAFDFSHGTATNLQVGSISLTDRATVHGNVAIDTREARAIAFSAGFLHNEPLGETSAVIAAGTGNAAQLDAGFTTRVAKNVLGVARYSFAYQFGQGGNLPSTVAHVFYLGVSASIRNTDRVLRPVPVRGHRVDGTDSFGFPDVEPPEPPPAPPSAPP